MLDVLMIALSVGFFAACLVYMAGCERLQRDDRV
jgi:hypothetical protein